MVIIQKPPKTPNVSKYILFASELKLRMHRLLSKRNIFLVNLDSLVNLHRLQSVP